MRRVAVILIGGALATTVLLVFWAVSQAPAVACSKRRPCPTPTSTVTPPASFVTRSGTGLQLNGRPYKFVGFNYTPLNRGAAGYYSCGPALISLDQDLSAWTGTNRVMRVWAYQSWMTRTDGSRTWAALDTTINTAAAHGVRVILVLTNQWGNCDHAGTKNASWYQGAYKNAISRGDRTTYRDYVRELAARYANDPTVIMYQLGNEIDGRTAANDCTPSSTTIMRAFVSDMTTVIRGVDPNHLISGGATGGWCGTEAIVPSVDVADWHDYDSPSTPVTPGLAARINEASAAGIAVMVAESGIGRTQVGTLQDRADAFDAKIGQGLAAGLSGYLVWEWTQASTPPGTWSVRPGDPLLPILAGY
jgi:mannan endo-1,4-beta-mannosidase